MQNGTPSLDELEQLTEPKPIAQENGSYTTERGVVLAYRKISSDSIRRSWTAIPVPQPPQVWIEEHGRFEPNPADPGYNLALSQYNNKVTAIIHQVIMMRAVDVLSVPENVVPIESDDWFEGLEQYSDIPKGKLARKAAWLLDYILDDTERDKILEDIARISGMVTEQAVAEAATSFRGDGVQEADQQVPSEAGNPN